MFSPAGKVMAVSQVDGDCAMAQHLLIVRHWADDVKNTGAPHAKGQDPGHRSKTALQGPERMSHEPFASHPLRPVGCRIRQASRVSSRMSRLFVYVA